MFRWAHCQLDSTSKLRTVRSIRIALDELPSGLDETYREILLRVPRSDVEMVRKLLCWVAFAVLPLSMEELNETIAIECRTSQLDEEYRLSNPQDILNLCGSLVSVSDQGHVRLAHLSVKDYLVSSVIKSDSSVSIFALSIEESNEEMAIHCLTYLLYADFVQGPSQSAEDYVSRLEQKPLLKHTATAWPYYTRACRPTADLNDLIARLFSEQYHGNFLSWVQVLNADYAFKWDLYPRHATPLYYVASFGLTQIVENLVKDRVKKDMPGSRFGGTALHAAVLRFHSPAMRVLLEAGADPNRADFNGVTPLHTAAANGNVDVIGLLLEHGASTNKEDNGGETPYDWATKAGQAKSQALLLGLSANDGETERRVKDGSNQQVWKRVVPYFPNFYDKRTGLQSSIVLKVEIGANQLMVS